MSNERPDEFFSWRSRLDRPDALPEQGLADRNGSWEKLASRLRKDRCSETPRRRIAYRLAAACLVLALIPAAFLFHPVPQPSNPAAPSSNSAVSSSSSPAISFNAPTRTHTSPAQPLAHQLVPAAPSSGLETTENSPVLQSGPTAKDLARRSASNQHPGASSALQRPDADPRLPVANLPNPPAGPHNPARPAQTPPVSPDLAVTRPDPLQKHPPALAVLPHPADSPKLYSRMTEPPPEANKPLINKQLRIVHINELEPRRRSEPALTSAQRREPEIKVLILFNNH